MKIQLRLKLIFYSIALVSFSAVILFAAAFHLTRRDLIADIGIRMEKIAGVAAMQIDGDLHEQIQSEADVDGEAFTAIRDQMRTMVKAASLDQELYTLRPKGEEMEFVVMSHMEPFTGQSYAYKKYDVVDDIHETLQKGKCSHTGLYESKSDLFISGYAPIRNSTGDVVAILCVDYTANSFNQELISRLKSFFWLSFFALFLTIPTSLLAIRTLTRRVKETVNRANQAANEKDLTIRLNESGYDEMAELARSFNGFTDEIQTFAKTVALNSQQLNDTSDALSSSSEKMSNTARDMLSRSSEVATITREAAEKVASIAHQAASSASRVEEVAHANSLIGESLSSVNEATAAMSDDMDHLAKSVHHVSTTIQEVAKNIEETSQISHQATATTNSTNARVMKLDEAAQEIGKVVKVITQIAEKTNLLALNASIEAARAGEAGRGFAVVATEVKELAFQTARSTEDIQAKILDIQSSTAEAIQAIGEITSVISTIDIRTSSVTSAIEQQRETVMAMEQSMEQTVQRAEAVNQSISEATELSERVTEKTGEALRGARSIATHAREVADSTQVAQQQTESVSKNVAHTAESAAALSTEAEKLSRMAGELKTLVSSFKTD